MLCIAPPSSNLELALYLPYQWPAEHRTVSVRFLNGHPTVHWWIRLLIENGWNRASGLQFVWTDGPADVRVSFDGSGANWSFIGAYALSVPESQPTMVLSLTPENAPNQVRRVVLHEFGHAAGFLHEQQSPNATIPWDEEAVYAYYRARGWDDDTIRAQVLSRDGIEVVAAGTYDTESIMHYGIPAELTLDRVGRGGADRLSDGDRAMAQVWYGPPPALPDPPATAGNETTYVPIARA